MGARHLKDLQGNWKIDIWVLNREGKRTQASGLAQGIAAGDNGTRLLYREIKTEGFDEVLNGVGEYLVDKNSYNFYLTTGEGEEMVSGGILRSGVRVELRIASPVMFIADTYTLIDGKEVQVQSYRFTKS